MFIDKKLYSSPRIGCQNVPWANSVLKIGIKSLKNKNRYPRAVLTEVSFMIRLLKRRGYWWQAKTLGHWQNRYLRTFTRSSAEDLAPPRGPRGIL